MTLHKLRLTVVLYSCLRCTGILVSPEPQPHPSYARASFDLLTSMKHTDKNSNLAFF